MGYWKVIAMRKRNLPPVGTMVRSGRAAHAARCTVAVRAEELQASHAEIEAARCPVELIREVGRRVHASGLAFHLFPSHDPESDTFLAIDGIDESFLERIRNFQLSVRPTSDSSDLADPYNAVIKGLGVGKSVTDSDLMIRSQFRNSSLYEAVYDGSGFQSVGGMLLARSRTQHLGIVCFYENDDTTMIAPGLRLLSELAPAITAKLAEFDVPGLVKGIPAEPPYGPHRVAFLVCTRDGRILRLSTPATDVALSLRPREAPRALRHLVDGLLADDDVAKLSHGKSVHLAFADDEGRIALHVDVVALEDDALSVMLGHTERLEIGPAESRRLGRLRRATHSYDKFLNQGVLNELDDVDRKIVLAMVRTKVPNKQLAIDMQLNFSAFAKRVERIAKKLDIKVDRGHKVRPILRQLLTTK